MKHKTAGGGVLGLSCWTAKGLGF